MMDDRTRALCLVIREMIAMFLGGFEDFLDIPYDNSILARRRSKVRQ